MAKCRACGRVLLQGNTFILQTPYYTKKTSFCIDCGSRIHRNKERMDKRRKFKRLYERR